MIHGFEGWSLDRKMERVLFEFRLLIAWGGTLRYDSDGGGGVAQSKPPAGVNQMGGSEETPFEEWRRRWDGAVSSRAKRLVFDGAMAELAQWHKRPEAVVTGETEGDLEARVVREGEGWGLREIAQHCRCTEKFARKARMKAGVSLETGKGLVPKAERVKPDVELRRAEVQRMKGKGMANRQIAQVLECDEITVRRDLQALRATV